MLTMVCPGPVRAVRDAYLHLRERCGWRYLLYTVTMVCVRVRAVVVLWHSVDCDLSAGCVVVCVRFLSALERRATAVLLFR